MFAETTICLTINESELAFAYKKLFTQELTEQNLLTQLFFYKKLLVIFLVQNFVVAGILLLVLDPLSVDTTNWIGILVASLVL